MPSGLRFAMVYREFQSFLSTTCSIELLPALAKDDSRGLRCSNAEIDAFETALSAASLGTITKERRQSGTALLIEGPNTWMTVVLADINGGTADVSAQQRLLNPWVETSVLKSP
ncbi:hypothetical protein EFQ99_17365 [Rhizobium vallis]|uniref:Uncharacterized protein n=2 Tax=Rhizobium vallis TaxID=634290 RepID=A0A3S0QPS8_9HYPH|nr:hypothetical protein EFQ99_17365 [Rhizobium vallis]